MKQSAASSPHTDTLDRFQNQRIAGIDLIRLIALFAIVVGHAYTDNQWVDRFIQTWWQPIFFVLSGYFWSHSRTLGMEISKRTRTLILPYMIWGVVIAAVAIVFFDFDPIDTVTDLSLGGSYAQRSFTAFWFLTALFAATVMLRLLDKLPSAIVWVTTGALLALNMIIGPYLALVPHSLATATGALFFVQLGRLLAELHGRARARTIQMLALVMIAMSFLILAILPGDFEPLKMKVGNFPVLALAISMPLCASMVLLGTTINLPKKCADLASVLAKPSLVVIALHPLLLIALSGKMPFFLVPILAFGASLTIGLAIVCTPLSRALAGVPQFKFGAE